MRKKRRRRPIAIVGTLLAISIGLVFVSLPLLSGVLARFVPASVEATVGAQMIEELGRETEFCQHKDGLAALSVLTNRLVAQTGGTYEFRVYVADQAVLNAFAAPGGHVVLYRSVIDQAETPNEVAGVLAHEIAHITAGHPARGMLEALGYGVFALLTPGQNNVGGSIVQSTLSNHYSREDELEADRSGVALLNRAGVDSRGLLVFFERLSTERSNIAGALEFLSTHPSGETRTQALRAYVSPGEPALTDAQWQALKRICEQSGSAVYVSGD